MCINKRHSLISVNLSLLNHRIPQSCH
uniref:Uncharacterized protein n=1 Tax=Anguilla anguilla TaxID=7936 RepID=A0A0E9XEN7_ANGAN